MAAEGGAPENTPGTVTVTAEGTAVPCSTRVIGFLLKDASGSCKAHVEYKIEVTLGSGDQWITHHRYNDFHTLVRQLESTVSSRMAAKLRRSLPDAVWSNMRYDVVMSRCHQFDGLLDLLLESDGVANSPAVRAFLDVDEHCSQRIALAPPSDDAYEPVPADAVGEADAEADADADVADASTDETKGEIESKHNGTASDASTAAVDAAAAAARPTPDGQVVGAAIEAAPEAAPEAVESGSGARALPHVPVEAARNTGTAPESSLGAAAEAAPAPVERDAVSSAAAPAAAPPPAEVPRVPASTVADDVSAADGDVNAAEAASIAAASSDGSRDAAAPLPVAEQPRQQDGDSASRTGPNVAPSAAPVPAVALNATDDSTEGAVEVAAAADEAVGDGDDGEDAGTAASDGAGGTTPSSPRADASPARAGSPAHPTSDTRGDAVPTALAVSTAPVDATGGATVPAASPQDSNASTGGAAHEAVASDGDAAGKPAPAAADTPRSQRLASPGAGTSVASGSARSLAGGSDAQKPPVGLARAPTASTYSLLSHGGASVASSTGKAEESDTDGGDSASAAGSSVARSMVSAPSQASMTEAEETDAFFKRARTMGWEEAVQILRIPRPAVKVPNNKSSKPAKRMLWLVQGGSTDSAEWSLMYDKSAKKRGKPIRLGDITAVKIGKGSLAFRQNKKAKNMKDRHCMSIHTEARTYDFQFAHSRACVEVGAALKRLTVIKSATNRWSRVRAAVGAAGAFGGKSGLLAALAPKQQQLQQ